MQILTFYERQRIEYYRRLHLGIRDTARRMKRNHSDIVRELRMNTVPGAVNYKTPKTTFSAYTPNISCASGFFELTKLFHTFTQVQPYAITNARTAWR